MTNLRKGGQAKRGREEGRERGRDEGVREGGKEDRQRVGGRGEERKGGSERGRPDRSRRCICSGDTTDCELGGQGLDRSSVRSGIDPRGSTEFSVSRLDFTRALKYLRRGL